MKILVVSMRSIHTIRWVSQLKESGHEICWFDILNGGYIEEWDWVQQHTNWRYKFGNFKGRFLLKKYAPKMHSLLENNVEVEFENVLKEFRPEVVHSFVMYKCSVPIFPVMKKYPSIKWIYSSWGSDLYYYRNFPKNLRDLKIVLPRIDYLFTDNMRDYEIAKDLGFDGEFLGSFPGGGGFHLEKFKDAVKSLSERKSILIKGYQGRSGRAITVLKSITELKEELNDYKIIVFGADEEVIAYIKSQESLNEVIVHERLSHDEVLNIMGESYIYVGNSNSDGMPNTLLEAIIMGAFPIQSNPGGATEEIIDKGVNGLLIEDCEDSDEIKGHIRFALSNNEMIENAFSHNQRLKNSLSFEEIQLAVLKAYKFVGNDHN